MSNRKRMKKIRRKRIKSIQKQIEKHEDKIAHEEGRLDTEKTSSRQKSPTFERLENHRFSQFRGAQEPPHARRVLDTTKDYWRKEIDEKFLKQIEEDKKYLEEK